MYSPRYSLTALLGVLSFAFADPNSVCLSYGVDFVDEGSYFINTLSSDPFTCVSNFSGCNAGNADVLFVDPNGDEYLCSQVPTTNGTPQLSTCPILKNQMFTGSYIILILGNNLDGNPFAWERDLTLTCGPQATVTSTSTVTFSITTTPTNTATSTSTNIITSIFPPTATITVPSATAPFTKTIYPPTVSTTLTTTFTKVFTSNVLSMVSTTMTVTASCTTTGGWKRDKTCTYSPTLIPNPARTAVPKARYVRDRVVDVEYARRRIEAAKLRRALAERSPAQNLGKRAPDAPTVTVTASTPVSATTTITAAPVTTTTTLFTTSTSSTTQPPVTVYSGIFTSTITAPTPTFTRMTFAITSTATTKTVLATYTRTITVTPSASVTACRNMGGIIG